MDKPVLVIDCDGVIMNSVKLIEDAVAKIDYRCSKKYIACVSDCSKIKEREIYEKYFWEDHETYDHLIAAVREMVDRYICISRITFDEVIEEVFPMYVGKINYNKIYQITNAYKGVIEKIKELCYSKKFRKVYICTHCNSKKEIDAKQAFFKEYLPMVQIIFVPFHDLPYIYDSTRYFENRERKRTNKPAYFFDITDEKPEETIFIDDSKEICDEAENMDVQKAFHRDRTSTNPLQVFHEVEEYVDSKIYTK